MKASSWDTDTDVRLRGWDERTEEDEPIDLELAISIPDRLDAILQLRDVQDLTDPRMYAV